MKSQTKDISRSQNRAILAKCTLDVYHVNLPSIILCNLDFDAEITKFQSNFHIMFEWLYETVEIIILLSQGFRILCQQGPLRIFDFIQIWFITWFKKKLIKNVTYFPFWKKYPKRILPLDIFSIRTCLNPVTGLTWDPIGIQLYGTIRDIYCTYKIVVLC